MHEDRAVLTQSPFAPSSADCRYHLSGIFSEGDKRDRKRGNHPDFAPKPASGTRPRKIYRLSQRRKRSVWNALCAVGWDGHGSYS